MRDVLGEYFCCPEGVVQLSTPDVIDGEETFFRFGDRSVCYGQCVGTGAKTPDGLLPDVLPRVKFSGAVCTLPFDPATVVDNLRLERYQTHSRWRSATKEPWRTLYYKARTLLPNSIRRAGQRFFFSDWTTITFPHWPVETSVDNLLRRCLALSMKAQGLQRVPFVWFWPRGWQACSVMTHDVETEAGLALCDRLMDLDDSYGVKSSFQLVPEERYAVPNAVIDRMKERGFEVNVQDLNHDGLLYQDPEEFMRRVKRINDYGRAFGAHGFRAGVLYRNLDWYNQLNFAYDMSVPNVGHLEAQRGGCCTVMPYFIGKILELPVTTTQDYSLFYMLRLHSIDLWRKQIELIRAANGLVSFISHPDYLFDDQHADVYKQLLEHLALLAASGDIWITTPGAVNCWWRERSEMRPVETDAGWRVDGPGADQAVVAFAVLDGDEIRYELTGCRSLVGNV